MTSTLWMTPASERNISRHEPLCQGFIPPDERGQFGVARHSPPQPIFRQRRLFELSSHGLGDEWPPLPGKERKRGPGSPPRINTYAQEDLLRMLKTLIQPQPPLPARSAVSCITDGQASGSEWAGELRLRREDVSVCMCGCMCIYMECVSRFLEGGWHVSKLKVDVAQAQERTRTHTLRQFCKSTQC